MSDGNAAASPHNSSEHRPRGAIESKGATVDEIGRISQRYAGSGLTESQAAVAVEAVCDAPVAARTSQHAEVPDREAPTTSADGSPLPRYRLAISLLVDSHGVDATDATHRAMAALRIPAGPFPHNVDVVRGPGQRWMCTAEVPHAQMLMWREIESD